MDVDYVRKELGQYQEKIVNDVENCLNRGLENFLQNLRLHELETQEFRSLPRPSTWTNRLNPQSSPSNEKDAKGKSQNKENEIKKSRDKSSLPDKIFITRESYLTVLMNVSHMRIMLNLFYQLFFAFFVSDLCYNYFTHGVISLGMGTFHKGFVGIHYVFGVWLLEHIIVVSLFYAFKCWAMMYVKLNKQRQLQRFLSNSCLILHIATQCVVCYVAGYLVRRLELPFISAAVLLLETCRLLMKMHAFVRTNTEKVLKGKHKSEDHADAILPKFSSYLYFLFAPTIIYRDTYPRTSHIRWGFALARLLELFVVCFLLARLYERTIEVYFHDFGLKPISPQEMIIIMTSMVIPSITIFLCGFYLLLHSWMNCAAELMCFGDRMFYKDWWTSSDYDAFYRNWNIVVYDWLYEYVYKDCYQHIFKGSKIMSSLMVFYVSAIVHEIILGYSLNLFFPVLFTFFAIIGVTFVYLTRYYPLNNSFIWMTLIYGNAALVPLYCMEYYARFNCPKTYETWQDYLLPAIVNCKYGR